MKHGGTIGARLDRWLDEWKMAISGLAFASRSPKFLITTVIAFLAFGAIMNLLSSSTAALNLFWATNWSGKFSILFDSLLATFGVGRNFFDWLLLFLITLLQAVLIGLLVYVWQKKRKNRREQLLAGVQNSDNIQSVSLVAGLAVLGSGCPTCGTTLLMPVLGAIFSSSSYMLAGVLSGILTVGAILLALFTFKRIGREAYAITLSEKHHHHHNKEKEPHGNNSDH